MFDKLSTGDFIAFKSESFVVLYNGSDTFNVYNSEGDEIDCFSSSTRGEGMMNDEAEEFAREHMEKWRC